MALSAFVLMRQRAGDWLITGSKFVKNTDCVTAPATCTSLPARVRTDRVDVRR